MTWQDIAKVVAPNLAAALPPPFNVIAGAAVRTILGLSDNASDADVEKQLANANPEILLKLKEADNKFKTDMAQMGVDLEKIAADDRDSARKREVATGDNTNKILAWLVVTFWAIMNFYIVKWGLPESVKDPVLYRLLGTLDATVLLVLQYYFGSSVGSNQKNATIENLKNGK